MRVIIIGAGEVGSNIAASFASEHHVTVVDVDPETVEDLTYSHDVLAIEGDGTDCDVLIEAGIEDADLLIASTDDDETNLATCATAKTAGDTFTIARVRNVNYLDTWNRSSRAFDVDHMVSPDVLTAENIADIVGLPSTLTVDPFAGGEAEMGEFELPEGGELVSQTVEEADRIDGVTIAALVRDGDVTIPSDRTTFEVGDKVVVIGRPDAIEEFSEAVTPPEASSEVEDVVIVGGSRVGYHTARLLEERGLGPRLIERDADRARELAGRLEKTVVMNHDGTDLDFLLSESVDEADTVVTALPGDETNLMMAQLAKGIGVGRTVTVIENGEYADIFERVGIDVDVAANPRKATAEEIVRFTQGSQTRGRIENLSLVEDQQAEVLEVEVDADSALGGRSVGDVAAELPEAVVFGAITRDGEFVAPRGETVVEPGDHVVLFVAADVLSEVSEAI
ncbi:Trk system potassium transporter TrkA [Haloarcula nitratireducens]|uniref:Trk system potassium transporter TrkA n=1 Tax=Haloarcula nitratireducens TaxID=2487749 RepID=A0AAW4PB37_9EURY|nr:Trk system potassium transporter TrkA [Halomicroarcula nitratireducens]MBX0295326.1 Trk system potassium transporter TrkA [Halomicroarcula nitratireducens]